MIKRFTANNAFVRDAGEILRHDILEPLGITMVKAARSLDISRKTLSKICNANGAITPEMAVRLELVFGKPSAAYCGLNFKQPTTSTKPTKNARFC